METSNKHLGVTVSHTQCLSSSNVLLLPEYWVHLLIGVEQKIQPSPRAGKGRTYYLQQVRRTLGIFPKAVFTTVILGKS